MLSPGGHITSEGGVSGLPVWRHGRMRRGRPERTTCHNSCTLHVQTCPTGTGGPGSSPARNRPICQRCKSKSDFFFSQFLLSICCSVLVTNLFPTQHHKQCFYLWKWSLAQTGLWLVLPRQRCTGRWSAGLSDLRSAVHLHRVASVGEVLVTEPGTVTGQVQSSAGEVPLLEKGHLTRAEHIFVNFRYICW